LPIYVLPRRGSLLDLGLALRCCATSQSDRALPSSSELRKESSPFAAATHDASDANRASRLIIYTAGMDYARDASSIDRWREVAKAVTTATG